MREYYQKAVRKRRRTTERQRDRQTDIQTDRLIDKQRKWQCPHALQTDRPTVIASIRRALVQKIDSKAGQGLIASQARD